MFCGSKMADLNEEKSEDPKPKVPPLIGEKMEEFDDLLEFIGSSGRYQKLLLYGSLGPISFIIALLGYNGVFTLFIPDHFCSPGVFMEPTELDIWKQKHIPMETGFDKITKFSSCNMYNFTEVTNKTTMRCQNGWIFDKADFDNTIPTDYNWVCEKDFYPTQVFTVAVVGMFIGNIVFGPLADKYGRKPLLFISLVLYMGFVVTSFFVPHIYEIYIGVIFIGSTGFPMVYTLPPLLMAELTGSSYRAWVYTVSWVSFVFGMAVVPIIAYFARKWFLFGMCVTAPGFLMFFLFPLFPESRRWLVTMGRVEEAAIILRKIAKINGTSHKVTQTELQNVLYKLVNLQKEKQEKVLGFWTLFSTKRLATFTILISICWSASSMIYEQITLNTPYMSGNQFLNFFLLALVELPGSIVAGFLIGRYGRRWTPVAFGCFMATVCIVAGFGPQDMTVLIIACILLAKFAVTVTFYVVYLQATELFPTSLRATGSAICSTFDTSFALLNPSVVYTGRIYSGAPYLVMTLLSLIGCICASFLPETLNQHLPETLEDAEDFGKEDKYWSLSPTYNRKLRKCIRRRESQIAQELSSPKNTPSETNSTIMLA